LQKLDFEFLHANTNPTWKPSNQRVFGEFFEKNWKSNVDFWFLDLRPSAVKTLKQPLTLSPHKQDANAFDL
jgi:hypothetical protein